MKKKYGSLLFKPNKGFTIKQLLTKLRKKHMKLISVEMMEDRLLVTMEWKEFSEVNLRRGKKPPIYNKQFFLLKGITYE